MSTMFDKEFALTPSERKKITRREPKPRGHVMPPGTGPDGQTCGSCKHLYRNRQSKTYLKCGLNRSRWTGGRATDILARDKACKKWEAAP